MPSATWESVSDSDGAVTTRMGVPGGWLYRVMTNGLTGSALAFVPLGGHGEGTPRSSEQTEGAPRLDD